MVLVVGFGGLQRNGKDQGSINLLQSSNITKRGLNQGLYTNLQFFCVFTHGEFTHLYLDS